MNIGKILALNFDDPFVLIVFPSSFCFVSSLKDPSLVNRCHRQVNPAQRVALLLCKLTLLLLIDSVLLLPLNLESEQQQRISSIFDWI